jgi:outer membrane protein assembly factor BamB
MALVAAVLASGCGGSSSRTTTSPGTSTAAARSTPAPARSRPEWRAPNADLANTRRLDGAIDAANVHHLRVAWTVPLRSTYAATPIVVDGVVYTADRMSNVYAIDFETGTLRWRTDYNLGNTGPNGVNVADGRVFSTTSHGVVALDAETGRELWRRRLIRQPLELVVMTPGYKDGLVYVSTTPTDGGDMGTLWALEARTGRRVWGWEEGPRDLWGNLRLNGAGGLWHPPAFDDQGALYVSIADPTPWPGTPRLPWARSRPGPNKWSNSIVKLNARTGRFIWGTQALPHDFYDWDLECPVILARAGGRRVALTAGKMGYVYAFDADSGRLLWKRPVGLHNGHDDDSRRAMHGDYSNVGYGRRILPGDQGGVETQMASDGRTLYVPVNNLYMIFHGQALPEMQDLMDGTGEIVALDIATGKVRWIRKLPEGMYGGATITNDLVFTSTYDGTLYALARADGRIVWKAPLPAGSIAPVGIAGDTVLSAGSITFRAAQKMELVAFRLSRS